MAKPIFCLTHPRACSTAFERVFMTRTADLVCMHEPFGDAFYYGPERMSSRFEDEQIINSSGCADITFKTILDQVDHNGSEGKRVFIKDMGYFWCPPDQKPAQIAPSLMTKRRGIGTQNGVHLSNGTSHGPPFPYGTESEPQNPTVIPEEVWKKFHTTFLIRDPHSSIPSYYRCTVPPRDEVTKFYGFWPNEAGYNELRRTFDYLVANGQVALKRAGSGSAQTNGHKVNGNTSSANHQVDVCLVDADDLLDNPEGIIREYCRSVGLSYDPGMLSWDNEESHQRAREAFEKWKGFHDDAIESADLKPRKHKKKEKTEAQWDAEWKERYGEEGAKIIRSAVDENMEDYLYLKQFAVQV